jgi:hypothetical protein
MAGAYLGWALALFAGAALAAVAAVKPRWHWRLTEGWKYDDPDAAEESYLFHRWTAIGAAILAVVSLGAGIVLLVLGRAQWREEQAAAHCEAALSALVASSGDEAALEEVAAEHGVDLEAPDDHTSILDVYDGDDRIGWISPALEDDPSTGSYQCS